MSDDTLYNYWRPISRRVENSDHAGSYAKGPAIPQPIMLRPFQSIVKQSPVGRMAVSSSCEALQVICDSYIDESSCLQCRLRRCIPDDSATQIEKCWASSGKTESTCCNLFGKYWLVRLSVVPVVLSVMVVNIEQVPAPSTVQSRQSQ